MTHGKGMDLRHRNTADLVKEEYACKAVKLHVPFLSQLDSWLQGLRDCNLSAPELRDRVDPCSGGTYESQLR